MVEVNIKNNLFWNKLHIDGTTVYIKGYTYTHSVDNILNAIENLELEDVKSFINSLDGHFSIIVQKKEFVFMAVDKVCSSPIFFTTIKSDFYIDCDPARLVGNNGFKRRVRKDSFMELSMSGYTIGNKTIYKDLFFLKAGELIVFKNDSFKRIQYYEYFKSIKYKKHDEYIEELTEVTLNIFRKMLRQIGDKQIIVPLSAGNDSRLVASILKHLGANNVKCYSYGSIGNFEANIAEVVSKKLGYEWIFIPLSHKSEKKYYASKDYQKYLKFSETYYSVPYIQGLSAIKYLKDMNWIDEDAIFVNGNSGDFISGGHISLLEDPLYGHSNKEQRKENLLSHLTEKHFSLWGYLKTEKNIKKIKEKLWHEMTLACGENLQKQEEDHLFYEYSEFINRQSKYVITGQRVYEFYKHEWRMPLWDDEYLYFWQKVPYEFKKNQKIYLDMLKEKNFGNVWGMDIPVNKKTITPNWIIPIRFLFKIPFGLFGKSGKRCWKQFDKSIFYYWMDVTHMMDIVNYLVVVRDFFKKPRHHLSWQSKIYLSNKIDTE